MAKVPAFARAFAGRWRIVEMDVLDNNVLDLVEEAHLTFRGVAEGELAFGALTDELDVHYGAAMVRPARNSPGKGTMRTTRLAVVDG